MQQAQMDTMTSTNTLNAEAAKSHEKWTCLQNLTYLYQIPTDNMWTCLTQTSQTMDFASSDL